jgi:hypothetical protein
LAAKRVSEPPEAMALANPVLLTVATAGAEEIQVAVEVRSCVVPSEKVPVAFNCEVCPLLRRETLAGVMAMDWSTGEVTATLMVPTTFVTAPPLKVCQVAVIATAGLTLFPVTTPVC